MTPSTIENTEAVNPDGELRQGLFAAQAARIVELRYFAGLSIEQTAAALGLHASSVYREWQHARAWLRRKLA